jgi:hypothetical protein
MATTFKLSNTNTAAVTRLQPWNIYPVVFKGVEYKEGTSKAGKAWKAVQFKFSGEAGIVEPMFFCPGEKGDERMSGETKGRKWELPSQMELLSGAVSHILGVFAPSNLEKLKTLSFDFPDDFEKFVGTLEKALKSSINKATHIKLVGDSKGYAVVPNFVKINRDGIAYISNNWLGDNLGFTEYEVSKSKQAKSATPTKVDGIDSVDASPDTTAENKDLDFDI